MFSDKRTARSLVMIGLLLIVVIGIPAVFSQQLVQPDGRINQIAHFGGDALYCVDGQNNPINQLPTTDPKAFRLLNMDGQEIWYVPGHDVEAALKRSVIGGDWELIATGSGTYGPTALYTYDIGGQNGLFFVFTGYDEHGKANSLTFQSCRVGSAVPGTNTRVPTGTATLTPEFTSTPTETGTSMTPSSTPSDTPTNTPTAPSSTPSDTPTNTPSPTPSDTPTNTPSPTPSDTPTNTPSPTPSDTPTNTPSPTPSDTPTNTPTNTPSPIPPS